METEQNNKRQDLAVRPESTVLDIDLAHVAAGLTKIKAFQSLVQQQLVSGHDYGVIPGTKKPSLWKPGAEKLCKLLGLADSYVVADKLEDWQQGLFYYRVTCELRGIHNGDLISQGLGSCNSKESRYRYRWLFGSEVPAHLDKKSLKTMTITTKKGNKATMYQVENDDPFSLANTLLKMAKKRAMVDAVLSAGRLSDVFNQGEDSVSRGEDESAQSLEERRSQMLSYFGSLGVQPARVFGLIGVTGAKSVTSEHLAALKQIAANIKDGIASVEDFFGFAGEADKPQDSQDINDIDNEQPGTVPESETQEAGFERFGPSGHSDLDNQKSRLIDKICTRLGEVYPGDSIESQAARLKTLNHVFGKTVLDEIVKLPVQILEAGLGAIKSRAQAAEDIPVQQRGFDCL